MSQEFGNAVTRIERCTFARNTAPMGAAIYDRAYGHSHLVLQRNIYYENAAGEGSAAIDCRDSGGGGATCSDFWGPARRPVTSPRPRCPRRTLIEQT